MRLRIPSALPAFIAGLALSLSSPFVRTASAEESDPPADSTSAAEGADEDKEEDKDENEAEDEAAQKSGAKEEESAEDKPAACDPADPDCAPCNAKKKGKKKQTSCCDPEKSDLCVDMATKALGIPVPMYNPQLEFSLGVMGMITYHPIKKDKISPPWASVVFGMYTTNKSWLVAGAQEMYWGEDRNRARVIAATGKFNSEFYGTGSGNGLGVSLPLGSSMIVFQPHYMRRLWNRIFVGAKYRLLWNEAVLSPPEDDGMDSPAFTPVTSELIHSGFGAIAEYDTRDNRFSPTEGFYVPVESLYNSKIFGGDANFGEMTLAANYYHSWMNESVILASRGFMAMATDDTPPHLKPAVGMGADLRGYAYGRYRDNLFLAAQVEARWYFWWKLGMAAFAGIGTTAPGWGGLGEGTPLPSYGGGLRFLAFKEQRLVLRMDYARGNEDGQFYFSVSEAF